MEGIYPKSEFLPTPDCWFTSIPLGADLYRSSTWLSVACRNLLHSHFHACSSSYFLIPPGTGQPLPYKPVHLTGHGRAEVCQWPQCFGSSVCDSRRTVEECHPLQRTSVPWVLLSDLTQKHGLQSHTEFTSQLCHLFSCDLGHGS